jgi:hypothetical protein
VLPNGTVRKYLHPALGIGGLSLPRYWYYYYQDLVSEKKIEFFSKANHQLSIPMNSRYKRKHKTMAL